MKRINIFWIITAICLMSQYTYSQNIGDLKGINYQAVAIDENGKEIVGMDINGKPLFQKAISVRFTITKGLNGSIQWEETHTTTTDRYGLFTVVIGAGIQTGNGAYTRLLDIPWIDADQFLKVEISTKNDGNYILVSNQQFMTVPYSFYTDDIADDAITTSKILDSAILNRDVHTGAVDSRTIFDSAIVNPDIHTGAVDSRTVLDSAIVNEDIKTGAVDSRTLLDETILAADIATGAVATAEILDETILAGDIAAGAVTSSEILDETIAAADLDTGAVTTSELLNGTILNEDIANGTINLTSKVTGVLPLANGGLGSTTFLSGRLLVGDGTNPIADKVLASADSTIEIIQNADSIILKGKFAASPLPTSADGGTFNPGNIAAGATYISNAINSFTCDLGDIVVASVNVNLQGCMLTAYVSQPNVVRIAIFNGTGGAVNLGLGVQVKVYIIN